MRVLHYRWPLVCAAVLVGAFGVLAASSLATTAPPVPGPDSPDHRLTPGAHFAAGKAAVCKVGYSNRVRHVPESEKNQVYALYGIARVPYGYEVDHLVSLEVGGSNSIKNLWPEHYYDPLGARTKDRLENKLHALICSGRLGLASAKRQEAANWIAAYRKYVGPLPSGTTTTVEATDPLPTSTATTTAPVDTATTAPPATSPTDPYDPNGFYASSYATASTIYCADDSDWKGLSPTYLQHFATWAEAIAAHPAYHLHQPC